MSDMPAILELLRRGNTLEGLRRLATAPAGEARDDPTAALNAALHAPAGAAEAALIEREKTRHLGLLPAAAGPERAVVLYNLGCLALAEDDILTAKLRFSEAALLRPDHAPSHHNLALAHELMAEFDEARQALETALQLDPACGMSRINLALVAVQEGRGEEGLAALRELSTAEPDNGGALYYLCRALLERDHAADASQARELLESHPQWQHYRELRECHAAALLAQDEAAAAKEAFRALLAEDDGNLYARMGLIKALGLEENVEELLQQLQRYFELDPMEQVSEIIALIQTL